MNEYLLSIRQNARFLYLALRFKLHIMSPLDTIAYMEKHQCSVARFGDGELNMILTDKSIGFQKYDPALAQQLKRVLTERNPDLLLCLPHTLDRFLGEKKAARNFWTRFVGYNKPSVFYVLKEQGMENYLFGDTQMTRPYMDYITAQNAEQVYPALKKIWENRPILIVEGQATRMGVGNDLFANAASVRRIICPAENAFASYNRILQAVRNHHTDELVLIALGPAATVLAGFLSKATTKKAITGKYVNEVSGGNRPEELDSAEYLAQIVERIGI